jgi:hypothetical protein
MRPILNDADYERTVKQTNEFVKTDVAKQLQTHVLKVAKGEGYPYHYFEEAWDDMYYGGRWPLMVHVNPCFSLNDELNSKDQDQLKRAAKYATSMVRWWRKVVEGRLEPDTEKGRMLDGYQYPLVFGVERVPHATRDLFIPHGGESRHIIVIHRHRYHRVQVVAEDGAILSEESLLKELSKIRGDKGLDKEVDIGLLSTGARDHYAAARHDMIRVSPNVNGPSFRDLDTCLFVVVLEDSSSDSLIERTRNNLHGVDGSNRWFDKHQLIVHADGALGMCLEHGCNDGMTWLRMLQEVWGDIHPENPSGFSPLKTREVSSIRPTKTLEWQVNGERAQKDLQTSADEASKLVDDVDAHIEKFKDFGREAIKGWKVSPDAAVQMAYQLAYSRVNPKLGAPATYESCSMKPYFHGRTETIRSCTNEAVAMVKAFNAAGSSVATKKELLAKACAKHVDVANGARSCSGPNIGVDRHMLGLRTAAGKLGVKMPEVFSDPSFAKGSTWTLSTSNVTTPFFEAFAFGAVCGHGYGLGYMTLPNHIPVCVTSFASGQKPETSSKHLGKAISAALRDFASVQKA